LAKVINASLEKYFPDPTKVKVISEPGTFFAEAAFTLVANVHSKNVKIDEKGDEVVHYYITDGIYQSFNMNSTHEVPVEVKTLKDFLGQPQKQSILWGRACDPHDIVKRDFSLPELQCGDWLVFPDSGAYRISTSTTFNGFPSHPIYCFIEKEIM
jgi:ornithine decarboxylase